LDRFFDTTLTGEAGWTVRDLETVADIGQGFQTLSTLPGDQVPTEARTEFYRVEDDRGFGPYEGGVGMGPKFNDFDRHPLPWEDGIDMNRCYGWKFGFASMDDLRSWFSPAMLDYLENTARRERWDEDLVKYVDDAPYNFRVTVYSVPVNKVAPGTHQAVADPLYFEPVRTIPLADVHREEI